MKITTLTRKVPGLLLALFVVQMAAASAASAAPTASSSALQVEQRLAAMHYDVGPVDGVVDAQSSSAVMAFQKVNGLERTGQLTDDVAAQILGSQASPAPLVPGGGVSRVEVDLTRQVLFLYEGNALSAILPVSTGTAATPTPRGSFQFYRYDPGWHTSRLGQLYNAVYFVGGYAIHGSRSVPGYPASHGCIRIPMSAAEWFPSHVSTATAVYVI
jgi:peptidoglycan hydrolase-like protein with peptidoglycan-binding domain